MSKYHQTNPARTRHTCCPVSTTLPSGMPYAPFLNVAAKTPHDPHSHGHSDTAVHSDSAPRWAVGVSRTFSGLVSKTFTTVLPSNYHQRLIHTSVVVKDAQGVPNFSVYRTNPDSNRALSYFMVGSLGIISVSAAKSSVSEFLQSMAASADVLALAKVEVDLSTIPEGKNLVILGVCTHLGCVPIGEAGDFGGWFCPCHGSHYDIYVVQAYALAVVLLSQGLNHFVIDPLTSRTMFQRQYLEKKEGKMYSDSGVSADMRSLNRHFGTLHGINSLANLGAVIALGFHGIWIGNIGVKGN
ncbi:hypothetical protein BYT27DRAFT_7304394 [Phlegmacium glaucopus]|nr:hypothetical protein BYT27DRAFT_7304394 [Phlegmacium glaucopus]